MSYWQKAKYPPCGYVNEVLFMGNFGQGYWGIPVSAVMIYIRRDCMYRLLEELSRKLPSNSLIEQMFVEAYQLLERESRILTEEWDFERYDRGMKTGYFFGIPIRELQKVLSGGVEKYNTLMLHRNVLAACFNAYENSKSEPNPLDLGLVYAVIPKNHGTETDEDMEAKFPSFKDIFNDWIRYRRIKPENALATMHDDILYDFSQYRLVEAIHKGLINALARIYGVDKKIFTKNVSDQYSPEGRIKREISHMIEFGKIPFQYDMDKMEQAGADWPDIAIPPDSSSWKTLQQRAIDILLTSEVAAPRQHKDIPNTIKWISGAQVGFLTNKHSEDADAFIPPAAILHAWRVVFDEKKGFRLYTKYSAYGLRGKAGLGRHIVSAFVDWMRAMVRTPANKKLKLGKKMKIYRWKVKFDPENEEELPYHVTATEVPDPPEPPEEPKADPPDQAGEG